MENFKCDVLVIGSGAAGLRAAIAAKSMELRFASQAAELILQGALRRKESRGAHFREDYPGQDDVNWRGHLQVRLSAENKLNYTFQPIKNSNQHTYQARVHLP